MCIATQNPLEHRGTFPLPEARIDRFLMKVVMKPPGRTDEFSHYVVDIAAATRLRSAEIATG